MTFDRDLARERIRFLEARIEDAFHEQDADAFGRADDELLWWKRQLGAGVSNERI